MNLISAFLLCALLVISVISDWRYYKIYNKACMGFAIAGILCNTILYGPNHLSPYLLGLVIPFVMLFPLYALNLLGAGDIKLFCSIGTYIGFWNLLQSIAYSFLFGLVIAFYLMLSRRNLLYRFKKLYDYLCCCILSMSLMPYEKATNENDGKMHFAIPIALGTILSKLI